MSLPSFARPHRAVFLRRGASLAVVLACIAALDGTADADEVRSMDPATCAPVVKQVAEVVEENWAQVSYRVKAGQPIERIDTRLVTDVRRAEDAQSKTYAAALAELKSGNLAGARAGFAAVGGGGRTEDREKGTIDFKPFPAEGGKAKWYTSYAMYHYALASYREGVATGKNELIEDALRTVDADKGDEKGFLVRFREGKSRWYPDAWILKGKALLALGRYDEASATFDGLYQKSLTVPIAPRYIFEAKMGPGRIAEAKKDANAAAAAYEAGTAAIQSLLEQPVDPCIRRELGRLYNEARIQKARVMLGAAEASGGAPAYAPVRAYLLEGMPSALRKKLAGKPPDVVDAVVAGALSPSVQAIAQNGIGLANLAEKKWADAIAAFTQVRVKYFAATEEVPRALYHLAKAADGAAAAATKPDAQALYKEEAKAAREELARAWKSSPWAQKP